jgi:hypothetical protein
VRLQGSLYPERRSVPCLSADRRQDSLQEPTDSSNLIRSRPRKEVREGATHELGEVPCKPTGTRLQGSARPRT